MKISLSILSLALIVTLLMISAHAENVLYIVSGRVSGLAQLPTGVDSWVATVSRQWAIRQDLEARLDAALMELRACDVNRFDRVFEKYGLVFNYTDANINPETTLPCVTPLPGMVDWGTAFGWASE